jgi:hypothetical protein
VGIVILGEAKVRAALISCLAVIGAWATIRLTWVSDVHRSFLERLSCPLIWVVEPIADDPLRALAPQMVDLITLGVLVFGNAAIYGLATYWAFRLVLPAAKSKQHQRTTP